MNLAEKIDGTSSFETAGPRQRILEEAINILKEKHEAEWSELETKVDAYINGNGNMNVRFDEWANQLKNSDDPEEKEKELARGLVTTIESDLELQN